MTKSQGIFRGAPALTNNGGTSTGLSALGESIHRHQTYKRDTQKLSCESSSVNLKFESSTLYIRSHLRSFLVFVGHSIRFDFSFRSEFFDIDER